MQELDTKSLAKNKSFLEDAERGKLGLDNTGASEAFRPLRRFARFPLE